MNYEKLYHLLFNAITDALEQMEKQNYGSAKDLLITAQQKTEEIYIITESYPRRRAKQCRRRPRITHQKGGERSNAADAHAVCRRTTVTRASR